jgi:hypothetical protein
LKDTITAYALHEDTRVGQKRFGLNGAQTHNLTAALNPKRPHFPTVPGRAGSAQFLAATQRRFIVLASRRQIDAEERRSENSDYNRRTDRAEHVAHGIGNRHGIEQRFRLIGRKAKAINRVR